MANKKKTKKTSKKAGKEPVGKTRDTGVRYSPAERKAAVEFLREDDPTTVAEKTGITVDSLRRWGKAAGVPLIDGRTARSEARTNAVKSKKVTRVAVPLSRVPEPVIVLRIERIEGLTEFLDERLKDFLDERLKVEVQAFFKNVKVKTPG